MKLRAGDIIILQGEPAALENIVGAAARTVRNEVTKDTDTPTDDIGVIEGIVTPDSSLIGNTPSTMRLYDHFQVNLLAVSRAGKRIAHRLRALRFQPGDVIMLQGDATKMPGALGELHVLPLQRGLSLGRGRHRFIPVATLAIAMLPVAVNACRSPSPSSPLRP